MNTEILNLRVCFIDGASVCISVRTSLFISSHSMISDVIRLSTKHSPVENTTL